MGGGITVLSAGAFLVYLAKTRAPRLLYRPQFRHWTGAFVLWFMSVVAVALWPTSTRGSTGLDDWMVMIACGLLFFYYACVGVHERMIKLPHRLSGPQTVRMSDEPHLFLFGTGFYMLVGIGFLLAPFIPLCMG